MNDQERAAVDKVGQSRDIPEELRYVVAQALLNMALKAWNQTGEYLSTTWITEGLEGCLRMAKEINVNYDAAVSAGRERLDRIRSLHGPDGYGFCRQCRTLNGSVVKWPCPTYKLDTEES